MSHPLRDLRPKEAATKRSSDECFRTYALRKSVPSVVGYRPNCGTKSVFGLSCRAYGIFSQQSGRDPAHGRFPGGSAEIQTAAAVAQMAPGDTTLGSTPCCRRHPLASRNRAGPVGIYRDEVRSAGVVAIPARAVLPLLASCLVNPPPRYFSYVEGRGLGVAFDPPARQGLIEHVGGRLAQRTPFLVGQHPEPEVDMLRQVEFAALDRLGLGFFRDRVAGATLPHGTIGRGGIGLVRGFDVSPPLPRNHRFWNRIGTGRLRLPIGIGHFRRLRFRFRRRSKQSARTRTQAAGPLVGRRAHRRSAPL